MLITLLSSYVLYHLSCQFAPHLPKPGYASEMLTRSLGHFHVPGMVEQIGVLWGFGAYPEAISVICYEGGWKAKETWWPQVLEKMSSLRGQPFWDACGIFSVGTAASHCA